MVRQCSAGPPRVLEVVGVPPGDPEVVGRPSRRYGSGRETLEEVRKWSRGHPGGQTLVGRPLLRSGSGRETLPKVRKWSVGLPEG